jgi:hypothetical protein
MQTSEGASGLAQVRTRHWHIIMSVTGKKLNLHADHLRLRHILDMNPVAFKAEIDEICTAAAREGELELQVRQLAELWSDQAFSFVSHKERGLVVLDARSLTDIRDKVEDSLTLLASIASNKYAQPLEEEVQSWVGTQDSELS